MWGLYLAERIKNSPYRPPQHLCYASGRSPGSRVISLHTAFPCFYTVAEWYVLNSLTVAGAALEFNQFPVSFRGRKSLEHLKLSELYAIRITGSSRGFSGYAGIHTVPWALSIVLTGCWYNFSMCFRCNIFSAGPCRVSPFSKIINR